MSAGGELLCETVVRDDNGKRVACKKPARAFLVTGRIASVRAVMCERHLKELEEEGSHLAITLLGVTDVESQ